MESAVYGDCDHFPSISRYARDRRMAQPSDICAGERTAMMPVTRCFLGVLFLLAQAVNASGQASATTRDTGAKQPHPTKPLNPIAKEAAAVGVTDCVPRIQQMSEFLLADSQAGVHTFFPRQQPNRSLLSTSFEVISQDVSSYASASFAPVGTGGCGAMYEAVSYWQHSCDEVAAKIYPQMKQTGVLKQRVQVLEAGATARVFLMPAGTGCVSVKKEVLH